METQKKCSKCNFLKNLDDFYITQRGNRCKECILLGTRNYKKKKDKTLSIEKKRDLNKKKEELDCGKTRYYMTLKTEN